MAWSAARRSGRPGRASPQSDGLTLAGAHGLLARRAIRRPDRRKGFAIKQGEPWCKGFARPRSSTWTLLAAVNPDDYVLTQSQTFCGEFEMRHAILLVVLAAMLVVAGWSAGLAQARVADFYITVDAPTGESEPRALAGAIGLPPRASRYQ